MKFLFLILFHSSFLFASMDSNPTFLLDGEGLSLKTMNQVITLLEKEFQPWAQKDERQLEFLVDEDSDWAQAFARRWETDQVIVYGGVRFIKNITEDSLALILCHELGHLYAGIPYTDEHNRMATEGQADYWATRTCLPHIIPYLSSSNLNDRERTLQAIEVITAFYAENRSLPAPQLSTPDLTIVERTLFTHPSPQCRFDTYWAGYLKKDRPRCWFRPDNS